MEFERPLRLEVAYENAIDRLLMQFFKLPKFETWNDVINLLKQYSMSVRALSGFATQLAARMVTGVSIQNANSWREAARKSTKGLTIYRMLREEMQHPRMRDRMYFLIQSNAQLISTVPQVVAERAVHHVQQEQMKGRRAEDILHDLRPYMRNLKDWQVQRIARTEVAKADTAITRTRAEDMDLNWYVWETSRDARVRDSHKRMQGTLVNWNDAPSPEALVGEKSVGHYHAGNIYNCRCVALPVVDVSDVQWPSKVYSNGRITVMSLKQFKHNAAIAA
jgi:SPP1 gp7 family putative phage head morphogenesis protein